MSSRSKSNAGQPPPFGEWLRQLREDKGALQREVAAAADMDVAVLSKVELGQRLPTKEQVAKLAKFFGVDLEEMQGRWIAEDFRQHYSTYPGAQHAVEILAEQAGIYRVKK